MKFYRIVLASILFLFCIGGVCATDTDTNITDLDNNCSDNNNALNHDNVLYTSDDVTTLTNNTVSNDSSNLSSVPCAVSVYIDVMKSYNKTVDVKTGIKDTNTVNITGELSEKKLFKLNIGLIDTSLTVFQKYTNLKDNIKDNDTKRSFDFLEYVLFGDTLKPKMDNVLTIKKKLKPVIADSNVPDYLLRNFNNALTPMQENLNETISHLNYLINMIKKLDKNNKSLKSSHNSTVITLKHVDVPKLLDNCKGAITENNLLNQFVDNFKESVNNLNPLNANPKLREKLDQKYGLDHHKFGFFDYYTLK